MHTSKPSTIISGRHRIADPAGRQVANVQDTEKGTSIETIRVCVATRSRLEQCADLLDSLERADVPQGCRLEVVVVDNDPAGSAAVLAQSRPNVVVVHEPRLGIPYARNRAVHAPGEPDWIAFVDDDEVVDPAWVVRLHDEAVARSVPVTTGPVLTQLPDDAPPWATSSGLFDRRRHATGTSLDRAMTNNVLVRTDVLAELPGPFDERLALTGGSDTALFRELHRRGHEIVWVDDAIVTEIVPEGRVTIPWVLRRGIRYGNNRPLFDRLENHGRGQLWIFARLCAWFLAGLAEILVGTFVGGVDLLLGRSGQAVRWFNRAARGTGCVLGVVGWRYEPYRHVGG